MSNDQPTSHLPEAHYGALFRALQGNSILVRADMPTFTIVAATPGFLAQSGYASKSLVGKGVFEAFPANNTDTNNTGDKDLLASFQHVLRQKEPHTLPVQRYDVRDETGNFTERYWRATNTPVFGLGGKVAYILHTAEEITDQVKAEWRETQIDRIKKAFDLFMDAPIVVGLAEGDDYRLDMVNKEALKLWGKGPEIMGKPILEVLPELQGQGIIELFDHVRATGESYVAHEVPVTSLAGGREEQRYFNLVYQPYYNRSNTAVTGVFTISNDVTEQVRAKQRAEESEAKFRMMADSTPVLIAVGDETGNTTYFNKAWEELTGKPMEDLVLFGWADLVHPEDREQFVNTYLHAFAARAPFTGEFRVLTPEKEYCWLLAHGVPRYTADGVFLGYISACTNITKLKSVQEQLETVLEQVRLSKEAAELGTFDMDLEEGTMHWDDRCRTLFGISHHNPVRYENDFVNGLHPDDRERILKLIDQLFIQSSGLNGNYDVEYRTVGAEDGVIRWVRAKGKVYFNAQGKPFRFIGSVLDITEKVMAIQKIEAIVEERTRELAKANETLLTTNRELQRSNANLEEFAHAASHDLKEPVRKILFFTSLLKAELRSDLKDNHIRTLSRIENSTKRMQNLIDDLLLYSHVSERPQELETIDLNQKVQNALEDLELDIEEKKASVHVGKLPTIKGNRRQLQQMFQNLLSNALKYSKKDVVPQIEITADTVTEHNRPYHLIAITDNGIGFEQTYAEKIFQMFARLHGMGEYSGTGVGLSIVKKVVENHNGFIRVESALGLGSTFMIYLPV